YFNGLLPPSHAGQSKHLVIDMSSPNIAKEMHVGHLRSTVLGESLAHLYSLFGWKVTKINHIGDWGTQFGMLLAYLKQTDTDMSNFVKDNCVSDLQTMYKAAKKKFDEDSDFKKQSLLWVTKLQNKEPEAHNIWKQIVEISMNKYNEIYDQLCIKNLEPIGESFYRELMPEMLNDLKIRKLTEIDDNGRTILMTKKGLVPLILEKSDGATTYDTSDLCALKYRIENLKADKLLYVIDSGQSSHMKSVFQAALNCKYLDDINRAEHIEFGLVLDQEKKKFKTRSGETIKLQDLFDESYKKAEEALKQKRGQEVGEDQQFWTEVARSLGRGCIVYQDLSQKRNLDYIFSFERMLSDKGNTAAYLNYAHVRIRSILRKCLEINPNIEKELQELSDTEILQILTSNQNSSTNRLIKHLINYPQVLVQSFRDHQIYFICDYLYALASYFTDFYHNTKIIDIVSKKINLSALALSVTASKLLKELMGLMTIQAVEKI
ncbi:MAG: hypothetical protein MHPSP_002618, partial [Paramarteilia canceri]